MEASGQPFRREDLTKDEEDLIQTVQKSYTPGKRVRVYPPGMTLSRSNDIERLRTLEIFDDDVFIVTPPKCGTTWMQEIVWLLRNDVDIEQAKIDQFYRCPFVEFGLVDSTTDPYPEGLPMTASNVRTYMKHSFEYTRRMVRPRCIKSHLSISLLPPGVLERCKVVFVARNVKDMVVSHYHMSCQSDLTLKEAGFSAYAELFRKGLTVHAPGIPMMLEAFKMRNHPNMFFVTFEEMKRNFEGVTRRLAKFLGVTTMTEEKFELLKRHTTLDSFKANEAVNKQNELSTEDKDGLKFIRKGIVGDWQNHFDDKTNSAWDAWIQEQLDGTGFEMEFFG